MIIYIRWGKYIEPQGAVSIRKTVLLGMAIPMLKIRRPTGRLIFNMGIPIPGKTVFYIETGPWHLLDLWQYPLRKRHTILILITSFVVELLDSSFISKVLIYTHRPRYQIQKFNILSPCKLCVTHRTVKYRIYHVFQHWMLKEVYMWIISLTTVHHSQCLILVNVCFYNYIFSSLLSRCHILQFWYPWLWYDWLHRNTKTYQARTW